MKRRSQMDPEAPSESKRRQTRSHLLQWRGRLIPIRHRLPLRKKRNAPRVDCGNIKEQESKTSRFGPRTRLERGSGTGVLGETHPLSAALQKKPAGSFDSIAAPLR